MRSADIAVTGVSKGRGVTCNATPGGGAADWMIAAHPRGDSLGDMKLFRATGRARDCAIAQGPLVGRLAVDVAVEVLEIPEPDRTVEVPDGDGRLLPGGGR